MIMTLEMLQEITAESEFIFSCWGDQGIGSSDYFAPIHAVLTDHGINFDDLSAAWQSLCRTAVRKGFPE
jgi:hypothetical protein